MVARTMLLSCLVLLIGCPGSDKDSTPADDSGGPDDSGTPDDSGDDTGTPVDADDDGYYAADDCDDADPAANPGEQEICDGIDNDCDDDVDEDLDTIWYPDADGDGFGDAEDDGTASCENPGAFVEDHSDCDDDDDEVRPAADEVCDGLDNDCDGEVDGEGASDAQSWYPDADGDGYGDATLDVEPGCDPGAGYTLDATDCDDIDELSFPGADELCDLKDNDCDGEADEDAIDMETYYTDVDGDGYGDESTLVESCSIPANSSEEAGDCDDGEADVYPGAPEDDCATADYDCDGAYGGTDEDADGALTCEDCDDTDASVYPGAAEVCGDGVVNDCLASEDDAVAACVLLGDEDLGIADARRFGESSNHGLGAVVAGAGDNDGDGLSDMLASGPDIGSRGRVYLFWGPQSGDSTAATHDAEVGGESVADDFGSALAAADVDGDGYSDPFVGAYLDDDGGSAAGAAYLLAGPVTGDTSYVSSIATAKLTGDAADDKVGQALDMGGDVDGDGNIDLFLGAAGEDTGGSGAGAVALFLSPVSSGSLADGDVVLYGDDPGGGSGTAVALADLDGDGLADLIVGERKYDTDSATKKTGRVSILAAGASSGSTSDGDWLIYGEAATDEAGTALSAGADADGDGYADLAVGAPKYDGAATNGGAVWLVLGGAGFGGTSTLSTVSTAVLHGHKSNGLVGTTVAMLDHSGDGVAELVGGSPDLKFSSVATGGCFLMYGPASGSTSTSDADVTLEGENLDDDAAISLANAGDTDGDGREDLLVGAPGRDRGSNADAGMMALILGSGY